MKSKNTVKQENRIKITIGILVLISVFLLAFDVVLLQDVLANKLLIDTLYLLASGLVFMLFLVLFGYRNIFRFSFNNKTILIILPALLIALNNFPISAYLNDRTNIVEPTSTVFLFLLTCLATGFAEEIIFRGIGLQFLLQRLPQTLKGTILAVLLSSLVFGLMHLFNIFGGSGVGNTLLQVGYSFLMGAMWAVLYLKTKNIWLVMILHGLYNFFGQVLFELGSVINRYDTVTIAITVILAVLVMGYTIKLVVEIPQKEVDDFIERSIYE